MKCSIGLKLKKNERKKERKNEKNQKNDDEVKK